MVIQSLVEEDINVKFLVQLDKLINLLETPVFAYLILQLLEPTRCKWLWKALYGLLMLLPHQSAAFKILKTRLKAVPSFSFSGEYYSYPSAQSGTIILEDVYTKHDSLASKVDLYVDDVKHRELAIVAFTMRKQLYYLIGALSNSKKLVAAVTDGSKFETAFFIIGLSLVDLVFLVCFVNKFYIFSSPRPPEVADLEDKKQIWGLVKSKSVNVRREFRVVVRAEMFGQLTTGLESAWNKLKGEGFTAHFKLASLSLKLDMVSLPEVRRFVQSISEQAVGVGVIRGVKPDQQLVKNMLKSDVMIKHVRRIVNDELVKLMGGEVSELVFAKSGPTVILLAGLQGVGKTTVCAKLAFYLKKQGKSCLIIAGDVYRPAAIDQLAILGEQISVPVYKEGADQKPAEIAKRGLAEAKKKNLDVVIMDTAGRLQIDKGMMDELKDVKRVLSPTEVLLVVDAMTGQEAAALVTTFNLEIGITGAILTKLDGDSRGGAALSVKEVSGKPIKLVGRGDVWRILNPSILTRRGRSQNYWQNLLRGGRVAQESGKTEQQVSQLVAQLFQMRVRMKNLLGVMESGGSIPALKNLEESLKVEQQAPPGTARRKRRSASRKQFVESTARPGVRGFGGRN
ncbi:unnamed protein product [Rhodiola kirilowii]